jgi:hypothetical protein
VFGRGMEGRHRRIQKSDVEVVYYDGAEIVVF